MANVIALNQNIADHDHHNTITPSSEQHPRKFSEKIAIQQKKDAENKQAFDELMTQLGAFRQQHKCLPLLTSDAQQESSTTLAEMKRRSSAKPIRNRSPRVDTSPYRTFSTSSDVLSPRSYSSFRERTSSTSNSVVSGCGEDVAVFNSCENSPERNNSNQYLLPAYIPNMEDGSNFTPLDKRFKSESNLLPQHLQQSQSDLSNGVVGFNLVIGNTGSSTILHTNPYVMEQKGDNPFGMEHVAEASSYNNNLNANNQFTFSGEEDSPQRQHQPSPSTFIQQSPTYLSPSSEPFMFESTMGKKQISMPNLTMMNSPQQMLENNNTSTNNNFGSASMNVPVHVLKQSLDGSSVGDKYLTSSNFYNHRLLHQTGTNKVLGQVDEPNVDNKFYPSRPGDAEVTLSDREVSKILDIPVELLSDVSTTLISKSNSYVLPQTYAVSEPEHNHHIHQMMHRSSSRLADTSQSWGYENEYDGQQGMPNCMASPLHELHRSLSSSDIHQMYPNDEIHENNNNNRFAASFSGKSELTHQLEKCLQIDPASSVHDQSSLINGKTYSPPLKIENGGVVLFKSSESSSPMTSSFKDGSKNKDKNFWTFASAQKNSIIPDIILTDADETVGGVYNTEIGCSLDVSSSYQGHQVNT